MALSRVDWSRVEVELIVTDYLSMLTSELGGVPYSKSDHRRRLARLLKERSDGSIEFKHANISAVMIDLGFPYVPGYLPRFNYQDLLYDVVAARMGSETEIERLAAKDAEDAAVVPEVDDILEALTDPPTPRVRRTMADRASRRYMARRPRAGVNYLEIEARNQSLGRAGEEFVVRFEQARLVRAGREHLASKIEHLSLTQGDGAGFDILSFEETGGERFIEVKTTRNGKETPFFLSRNEVEVSSESGEKYHLYRVFEWRTRPRLFTLAGALAKTCDIEPSQYIATVA
jgi:Domain of unknown function (DUF3883)